MSLVKNRPMTLAEFYDAVALPAEFVGEVPSPSC
jgi:hypothetical protein